MNANVATQPEGLMDRLLEYVGRACERTDVDGWRIEGHIEGVAGWSIGEAGEATAGASDRLKDAESPYQKLERRVVPLYDGVRRRWIDVMTHAIALNGSFFHTHRMVQPDVLNAYFH